MDQKENRSRLIKITSFLVFRTVRSIGFVFLSSIKKTTIPKRLLLVPQDLKTADPTIAHDIYSGLFVFEGRALQTYGYSPFTSEAPSYAWEEELCGFSWLRHLRAAGTVLAQTNAVALVNEFFQTTGFLKSHTANETHVIARRLISFLCQSPLLLEGANHVAYHSFMKAIGSMVKKLEKDIYIHPLPYRQLQACIALCYSGLCCEGLDRSLKRTVSRLDLLLQRQILPDGGHISRNPKVLVDLLLDMLPLKQLFISRGLGVPSSLQQAIDRMLPMLRLFRMQDGTLCHFNGVGVTATDHLATLLIYDEIRAKPNCHSPYSGYIRYDAHSTVLVCDIGAPPPWEYSQNACAGCLSFELTSGAHRLIVNCGMPFSSSEQLVLAARSTAAHSTLSPDDLSQVQFLKVETKGWTKKLSRWVQSKVKSVILSAPIKVDCQKDETPENYQLIASHQAYLESSGFTHQRVWNFHSNGSTLKGEDSLFFDEQNDIEEFEEPISIRFHIAPHVKAQLSSAGNQIYMELPNGELWQFSSEMNNIALEESMFFAVSNGMRPIQQIVLKLYSTEKTRIHWRFDKIKAAMGEETHISSDYIAQDQLFPQ